MSANESHNAYYLPQEIVDGLERISIIDNKTTDELIQIALRIYIKVRETVNEA